MSEVFIKIVNMSISASWIVLAVLLLRLLLKKAPKWIAVLLWGIVAIRLILPFSVESVMSLIPSAEAISPEIMTGAEPSINTGISAINNTLNPIISNYFAATPEASANPLQTWIPVLSAIWITGIAILLAYTVISYLRVRRKVCTAVLLRDNVYQSEAVISPFVLGVIKPKIYLPFNMNEQDEELVIAHEEAHIRRKDHLWKPFGFLILALHWFNPLIWLGYVLLCRDIEIACDEKVVGEFTKERRADYSQALLTCSVNRRMVAACPLAFGEVGVKERVKSVLNYKKPAFWIIIVSITALIVASVCLLTNPKTNDINDLDDNLKVFLDMQVAEHNGSDESKDNFIAISYDLMKVDKSGSKTTVYAWILYSEYSYKNRITKESSSHIPTVITVQKNGDRYELVEYWTPRDGSYWVDDIKEKFPIYLWSRATNSQGSIAKQIAECEQMAIGYYYGILESSVKGVIKANVLYTFTTDKDIFQFAISTLDNTAYFLCYTFIDEYFGTYEDDGSYIVFKQEDGKFEITFKKENDNLRLMAINTPPLPNHDYQSGDIVGVHVPDGAVFEKVDFGSDNAIDSIVFDIDKDGNDERCVLRYGPTSGLFTFILSVKENGSQEYFNIYNSDFYYLSFDVQGDTLRIKGVSQDDPPKTEHFDIVIEGSNIVLSNDGQDLEYWGGQGVNIAFAYGG